MSALVYALGACVHMIAAKICFTTTGGLASNAIFLASSLVTASLWLFLVRTSTGAEDLWLKALVWDMIIFAAYFFYPIVTGIASVSFLKISLALLAALCVLLAKVVK